MLMGTIIIQLFNYSIGIHVLYGTKIQKNKWGLFAVILCIADYFLLQLTVSNMLYMQISIILILCALLEGTIRQRTWYIITGVFIISCSEELIEVVLDFFLSQLLNISLYSSESFLFANLVLAGIWLIFGMLKKRKAVIQRKQISIVINIAMGIMAVVLVLIIASIRYAAPYVASRKFSMISDILIIMSYFSMFFLSLFVIYINDSNRKYRKLLETEHLLRNAQKNNYEAMLAREEETKKFRHDINNHIMCLKELIGTGDVLQVDEYINQMQLKTLVIKKRHYSVGNDIIDAIINYYVHILDEDVAISVIGKCNSKMAVNNVDLCSIISNPLQNAIEAITNQQQGKRYLKIQINSTELNFKIDIRNSFETVEIKMLNGLPKTKKQDKRNHGIGLKNVQQLVEKNHGIFKIDILEGEFGVMLILPVSNKKNDDLLI